MAKYEYDLLEPSDFHTEPGVSLSSRVLVKRLNELGARGWEVVAFNRGEYVSDFWALLMREVVS